MSALLYTYNSKLSEGKKPLMILLHGYGANLDNLIGLSTYFPDYFVVSLQAPMFVPENGGRAWTNIFIKDGVKVYEPNTFEISREKVLMMVDYLIEKYDVIEDDITLLGFSQGAVMTHSLALSEPTRFKNIIALSGFIHNEFVTPKLADIADIKKLNIFIGHGGKDMVVPIEKDVKSTELLDEHDIKYTFKEYGIGHEISSTEIKDIVEWLKKIKKNGN
jgi:phospholipase/carboxylesterase